MGREVLGLCQHTGAGIQTLSVIPDFSYRPSDLLEGAATFRPVAGPLSTGIARRDCLGRQIPIRLIRLLQWEPQMPRRHGSTSVEPSE